MGARDDAAAEPPRWDGDDYQRRVEEVTAAVERPHGEADLVARFAPATVLDAGCGTGRVAVELARRGVEVVGVDVDPSMLATARRLVPHLELVEADLTRLDLGRRFDVVLLAGNVPLFTAPGTTAALVARCAAHVAPDGVLVAGFRTDGAYRLDDWDREASAAGLVLLDRTATWEGEPHDPSTSTYAVSIHGHAG